MKVSPKIFLLLSLALILMISGCNLAPAVKVEPTIDIQALRAEIVGTVIAQITADAPRATLTSAPAPTQTVKPTSSLPTVTQSVVTLAPLSTFTASALITRYPPWTPTPYTDRATLSLQSLADGITLTRGQDFDVKWVIKNAGVRDWNDQFYFRYISGIKGVHFDHVMLPPIKKGDEAIVVVDFVAPLNPGYYASNWGLVNDDGVTFFRFNFVFYVK